MSREIKFRGWAKDTNEMVPWEEFTGEYLFEPDVWDIDLMQYTGLKDKNGKEIYEGDIVVDTYYVNGGSKYKVEYQKTEFVGISNNGDEYGLFTLRLYLNDKRPQLEIVGNIYETPHLLNSEPPAQESDTTKAT